MTALLPGSQAADAEAPDPVTPYHAGNEAFIRQFRTTGAHDTTSLAQSLRELEAIAATARGEVRIKALLEIGFIQRVSNNFVPASSTYAQAAEAAHSLGLAGLAVDAWIGLARTQSLARDHGAAAGAIENAVQAAGPNPTPKQRFQLVLYSGELAYSRGEIESALAGALDAIRWAEAPEDRFYGELDAASALEGLAEACDYHQLHDSRTSNDPAGDRWGGCRRAVTAAGTAYSSAGRTADHLGWRFLADQARTSGGNLSVRRQLIDFRSHDLPDPRTFPGSPDFVRFTPRSAKDVLVHKGDFARQYLAATQTSPSGNPQLLVFVDRLVAEAVSAQGKEVPATLSMRGELEEMRAGDPAKAAELYARAADLLMKERASYFDARRRGAVVERQEGLLADLALRLLARNQDAAAFDVFEMGRARGLGELTEALARDDTSVEDRAWLAQQVRLDAQASAAEQRIVENVIGEGVLDRPADELSRWEKYASERRIHAQGRPDFRERLAHAHYSRATLVDLQRATGQAGVPVLLYWVANPNVYAWYVGPHGSDFRIVFLPQTALQERVAQLSSMSDPTGTFDEAAARQLYLYLIASFEDVLDSKQLIIVPQGEIVDVPFEALIDPVGGSFLIERRAISYAPNATMALRSLERPLPAIRQVTAIVDVAIDDGTHETKGIGSIDGLQLRVLYADDVVPGKLEQSLRGAQSAHILLHGAFNAEEPLLSTLGGTLRGAPSLVAADLMALPMRGTRLAVLSACESAEQQRRISNEIYGFPWALLAAGAENVVTSRWLVNGASNSAWMRSFYGAAAGGASPAEAAAAAVRSMLKQGDRRPYQWAAMQVSGR